MLTSDQLASTCGIAIGLVHGCVKDQTLGPDVLVREGGHALEFHEEAVGVIELRKSLASALGEQASLVGDLVRAASPHIVRMWRGLAPMAEILVRVDGNDDVELTIRPSFIRKAKARLLHP